MLPELQEIRDDEQFAVGTTGAARPRAASAPSVPAVVSEIGAGDAIDESMLPEDPCDSWRTGKPGQTLARSRKGFIPTVRNVLKAVRTLGWWRRIGYDRFRDEIMWCDWRGPGNGQWRSWTDEDYTRMREQLEADGFEPVGRELARDVVILTAAERQFDSAQLWLQRLQPAWDGTPRIDQFLVTYAGAVDSPYTRAVGAYLWTALAGRVLVPGVKADMVPVLVGEGGVGKSSMVLALVPAPEFACRINLKKDDDDNVRIMRGCLVAEIAELRGLHGRDSEEIKDFLSAQYDKWTPKYKEHATKMGRRLVFIGTTDNDKFLADASNNLRRWLPVDVHALDVPGARAVLDQLWAEGAQRFAANGVEWQHAQDLAGAEHDEYRIEDSWQQTLEQWLAAEITADEQIAGGFEINSTGPVTWADHGFTSRDALVYAIGLPMHTIGRREEMRMAEVLKVLGMTRKRGSRRADRAARIWRKG